ncbi:MAG TPA: sulfurtransferase TusA family protein [Anaeromyxobacteraceae bacterium]|nr:sulfurtransferase TusA family protein [Anaeromyxobacteraceae bacterium]
MTRLDIRPYACPLTWVKTRIALERLRVGESLEVLLAEGEALESVPRSAAEEGHAVLSCEPAPAEGPGSWRVVLEKGQALEEGV